jgi:hypothetical protein
MEDDDDDDVAGADCPCSGIFNTQTGLGQPVLLPVPRKIKRGRSF